MQVNNYLSKDKMVYKMKFGLISCSYFLILILIASCGGNNRNNTVFTSESRENLVLDSSSNLPFICVIDTPVCTDSACYGMYRGVEFVSEQYIDRLKLNGTDVAHQYSNKMCEYVGRKLKQLYRDSLYSKVDMAKIRISTEGMNSGEDYVEYKVYIPFKRVPKNQAMTAFDHCGGWGHKPELTKRKHDLIFSPNKIVKNRRLWISKLYKTKEGLEEFWIQWQHTDWSK